MKNVNSGTLFGMVNNTAEEFLHPIRWLFPSEEDVFEPGVAQEKATKITEDLEWLAGAIKNSTKKIRDQRFYKLERQTMKVIKRLQAFADRHECTYVFTVGFESFAGELHEHMKKIRSIKRAWKEFEAAHR